MPVDVVEQVRRLVEAFDELVDDVSADEVVQRVSGGTDSREPTHPTPERSPDRSSWRRVSLAAAAVVLVAGLVGALVWVNADRSTPSSETPPPTAQATVPAGSLGQVVWPVPPRGYATLEDLIGAFTAEVLAWDPSDTARVGDANDQSQPQVLTLVNEVVGGDVLVIAVPSPQGWGFVQIGEGLSASVDEGESVAVEFVSTQSAASSSIEARLSDGTTVTATATSPGRFELPEAVRLEEVVSALVVEFDEQGNVIAATGGMFASSDLQTPSTLPSQVTIPRTLGTADVLMPSTNPQESSPVAPSYTAIASLAGEDLLIDDRTSGDPRLIDLPPGRGGFDRALYSDGSIAIIDDGGRVLAVRSDGTITTIVEDAFSLGLPEEDGFWVGSRPFRAGSTAGVDWHWVDYAGASASSASFSLPLGALPFAGAEGWLAVFDRASGEILLSVNDETTSFGRGAPLSGTDLVFSFLDDDGRVVLVDVQTGDSRSMVFAGMQRPASTLQSADYSSDGNRLAVIMRSTDDARSLAKLVLLDLVASTQQDVLTIEGGSVVRWVDAEQVLVTGSNAPVIVNVSTGEAQEVGLPPATQAVPLFN